MNDLLIVATALISAFLLSEIALRRTKLQTGLARVLVVFVLVYIVSLWVLLRFTQTGFIAFTIFWSGAFLSWFGVRSHIESSILMRMLFLLRHSPLSAREMVDEYESHYGESLRMEELFRGALLRKEGDGSNITTKGRIILRIAGWLR